MAYFHTNYDASTMTVSVNDEEVSRALGVLSNKTPAALKVAVNTTARQTRKLVLTEVKNGQNQPHKALHGSVCSQCAACFSGTRSERKPDDRPERNQ